MSTDLHGNFADFERLRAIFREEHAKDPGTHWAILGDLVHGPSEVAATAEPELYGYRDESWAIVRGVMELCRELPERVHFVLGNHDHGHVGGQHTSKFHADEVARLEETLDPAERAALRAFFEHALLLIVAPCGLLLAHGSPGAALVDLEELDRLSLDMGQGTRARQELLGSILTSYGQRPEVTDRMLASVGGKLGLELHVVAHGHDRDVEGWFKEGHNQICPVIFGAPRERKRFLRLDLGTRYRSVSDLRDGVEIERLWPHPVGAEGVV